MLRVLRQITLPALAVLLAATAAAEDASLVRVVFRPERPDGTLADQRTVDGKIVVDEGEGGVLFQDRGGRLWPITPDRLISREETGEAFAPYSHEELVEELRKEFGDGFTIVTTRHYILCTEANREYARWAGSLFERLMAAFATYWRGPPLDVHEPEFPLVAVILKDKRRFVEYAVEDAGPHVLDALGYYSTLTNRIVMYDLTAGLGGRRPQNVIEFNFRLAGQIANVSTIVHEATHQIAFNSGLHTRLADNPFWLAEGLAMFFETPDLKNASGWRTVGRLNSVRLSNYREYVRTRRSPGSLRAMLTADGPFQAANTAVDAYAEAWALTDYLINRKRSEYKKYLGAIATKPALERDTAEKRIAEFEAAFGDIAGVEQAMNRYLATRKDR